MKIDRSWLSRPENYYWESLLRIIIALRTWEIKKCNNLDLDCLTWENDEPGEAVPQDRRGDETFENQCNQCDLRTHLKMWRNGTWRSWPSGQERWRVVPSQPYLLTRSPRWVPATVYLYLLSVLSPCICTCICICSHSSVLWFIEIFYKHCKPCIIYSVYTECRKPRITKYHKPMQRRQTFYFWDSIPQIG